MEFFIVITNNKSIGVWPLGSHRPTSTVVVHRLNNVSYLIVVKMSDRTWMLELSFSLTVMTLIIPADNTTRTVYKYRRRNTFLVDRYDRVGNFP